MALYLKFVKCIIILIVLLIVDVVSIKLNGRKQSKMEPKIIGGKTVNLRRFPSLVQFFNLGALCAGSILNSWTVLTAAHCFEENKDKYEMVINVGAQHTYDNLGTLYDIWFFKIHEDFNKGLMFACDIALIFLKEQIDFGKFSKKAVLVDSNKWMKTNAVITAMGWGWTNYPGGDISKTGLQMTVLRYVTNEECGRLHRLNLTDDMFCLYGNGRRDTCKGDSGGGVLWNEFLVGIVSHGDGCARKNKPSVYTNVWYFRNWIKENVNQFLTKYCSKHRIN